MKRPSFLRGLLFALFAGLGVLLWLTLAGPLLGYTRAATWYGLGLLPWYALIVAPLPRLGVNAFLVATALAGFAALFAPGPLFVFALTPFVLGIVRSAILFPRPLGRALFLEGCCNVLAVGAAAFFYDSSVIGTTFALWSFWLLQAGFALAPGDPEATLEAAGDPFEVARARALAVLERGRRFHH